MLMLVRKYCLTKDIQVMFNGVTISKIKIKRLFICMVEWWVSNFSLCIPVLKVSEQDWVQEAVSVSSFDTCWEENFDASSTINICRKGRENMEEGMYVCEVGAFGLGSSDFWGFLVQDYIVKMNSNLLFIIKNY